MREHKTESKRSDSLTLNADSAATRATIRTALLRSEEKCY